MKRESIISQLETAFRGRVIKPSNCLTHESDKLFYIEDNKQLGKCIVVKNDNLQTEDEQNYLKISNENNNIIALWAVDGCFLSNTQRERCDFIFFDENDFCFVEFKMNATSSNPQTVRNNRIKAIGQLKSMFAMIKNQFAENQLTFLGYNLEAYICTPTFYPNKNTAISDFAVEFLEEYGIKLFERNYKKCK